MRLIDADELLKKGVTIPGPSGKSVYSVVFTDDILNAKSIELTPQEPKTGHWMNKQHLFESCSAECSSCHKRSNGYTHDNGFSLEFKYFDFCPKCGCHMVESQESEG